MSVGIGMSCDSIPELCGGIFNSSKQKQGSYIGKYGIGLKAIMLYYQTALNVSSSTTEELSITSYQVLSNRVYNNATAFHERG